MQVVCTPDSGLEQLDLLLLVSSLHSNKINQAVLLGLPRLFWLDLLLVMRAAWTGKTPGDGSCSR